MLSLGVFLILAPAADWAHALALGLQCAALIVVVATSRASRAVRRARSLTAAGATIAVLIVVALGLLPDWLVFLLAAVTSLAIPLALAGGLLRLIRQPRRDAPGRRRSALDLCGARDRVRVGRSASSRTSRTPRSSRTARTGT